MVEGAQDAVMADEGLWKGKPRHEVGRRQERDAWLLRAPKRLIEAREHGFCRFLGVKPPLQARSRQVVKLADALEPKPLQQSHDLRLKAQGFDGERRKRGLDLSVRDDERS